MRPPLLAIVLAFTELTLSQVVQAEGLSIPFTKSQLPNGMTVILAEDHTVPTTVVNISYRVGSRFEQPHRTGFAHLFEHLMFMGTRRAPTKMFDGWMEAVGGLNNAWTSEDRTDYWDLTPSTGLPLLLWLESDRLRDLGPLMTLEKLDAQRAIVRNERRQTAENQPYGQAELRISELLYPEGHPYHHPVIGSHEDLEAASVNDVKQFFATYYDPANASLVVAGDFDSKTTLDAITKAFGSIPSNGRPRDPGAPGFDSSVTTLTSVVRETLTDNVELANVIIVWQSPKHFAPGDAELDLLSSILSRGKASRLYKSLVYEQKIAQEVQASQSPGTLGSRFEISVLARPGVPLERIEAAIDKELALLREKPVSAAELTRAENGLETEFVEHNEGVRGRASLLNRYEAEVGDPGYAERDLARYRAATPAALRDVAAKVLLPNARVIVQVLPKDAGK